MSFSGHELALVSSFFLTHPLITPYLHFILSYPSFPFFSSVIYPIPSIFHPLLHLHFIAYRYHLVCPPMALHSFLLFLHVQDTFFAPWPGWSPLPSPLLSLFFLPDCHPSPHSTSRLHGTVFQKADTFITELLLLCDTVC
jgi:hypothetical protein